MAPAHVGGWLAGDSSAERDLVVLMDNNWPWPSNTTPWQRWPIVSQPESQSVASRSREVILPPCFALEATYEAVCLFTCSSVQERQGLPWTSLAQGHKDTITGTGTSFIGAESQTAGTVWPGEKKAQGYIITVYINLMGRHEGEWASLHTLLLTVGEKDTTGTERQFSSTVQHMVYLLCWFWPG